MAKDIFADTPEPSQRRGRDIFADEVPTPSSGDFAFEPETPPAPPPPFEVAKIPESTAYGGVGGAFAPEIMKYGGKALQLSPIGQPFAGTVGRGMEVSGEALKGRRGASAASGAAGGFTGETVTQLTRSMGAPEPVAIGAGLVSSMVAPTAIGQLAVRSPWLGSMIRKAEEGGYGEAAQSFAQKLRGRGVPAESREAQERVVTALEEEARAIRDRGQSQANKIMSDAEQEIARLAPGAEQQAEEIRRRARDQAAALLFRASQQVEQRQSALRQVTQRQRFGEQRTVPEGTRRLIGEPREATDVGQQLRDRITTVQGNRLRQRSKQADTDKKAVATEVDAKQSNGIGIDTEPKYQKLVKELEQRLGVGEARLTAPFAEMTEPRSRRTLQEIYDVLKPVQGEVEGKPVTPSVSFESLDALRRRLGEVYRSPPAEGAAAMDANVAGDLYVKLSQILGDYAPKQKEFIKNYESLSRELDVFKGAAGRKATAVDRYEPESFVTDPAKLPSNYFSTRTNVQDLIELTGGDRKFVERQAASFVSRQLEGVRTPQAAAEFEARNRDWLREFPGLEASVKRYIDSLGFAETRTRRLTGAQNVLRTEIGDLPIRARKQAKELGTAADAEARAVQGVAGKTTAEARRAATVARTEANQQARMLSRTPKQDQVVYFDSLVSSGDSDALAAAAQVIKRSPDLMDSFMQGVRVSLSRMDPAVVADQYRRVVRNALSKSGLATESQLKDIDRQVRLIETASRPELRPGLTAAAIRNVLTGGVVGMGTTRLMDTLGLSFAEPFLGSPNVSRQGLQQEVNQ
jgi:hypothetical protein